MFINPANRTPVLTAAVTAEDVRPLRGYVMALEKNGDGVLHREIERLTPYFAALSRYLKRELDLHADQYVPQRREKLAKLIEPGVLAGLFNAVAEDTGETMLSEVVILPRSVMRSAAVKQIFNVNPARDLESDFEWKGRKFNFNFFRAFQRKSDKSVDRETAFPVLTLDDDMMEEIRHRSPERLLDSLQQAVTWINHDMLHHLTSYTVPLAGKPRFVSRTMTCHNDKNFKQYMKRYEALFEYSDKWSSQGYETWSLLTHAAVRKTEDHAEINNLLDTYFEELQCMSKDPQYPLPPEAFEYYSMVMGFAVMRTLDDSLIDHYCTLSGIDRSTLKKFEPRLADLHSNQQKTSGNTGVLTLDMIEAVAGMARFEP